MRSVGTVGNDDYYVDDYSYGRRSPSTGWVDYAYFVRPSGGNGSFNYADNSYGVRDRRTMIMVVRVMFIRLVTSTTLTPPMSTVPTVTLYNGHDDYSNAHRVVPNGDVYNNNVYDDSYGKSPVINWIGSDDWVDNAYYIYLDGDAIGGDTNINDSYGLIRINLSDITEK